MLILTDLEMSKRIYKKFRGTPFAKKVCVFHFDLENVDLENESFKKIGKLG